MHVSDATLRRIAWSMPVVYVAVGAPSLALGGANGAVRPDDVGLMLAFLLYTVVGALVAARQPRNPIGWLLGIAGLCAALTYGADQYAVHAASAGGTSPGAGVAAWLSLWLWMGMLAPLLFIVMLFPSGSLPSPRWRPVGWAVGAVTGVVSASFAFGDPGTDSGPNPFWVPALEPAFRLAEEGFILFVALLAIAVTVLVVRFRRSGGVERQQLKWIVAAAVSMVLSLAVNLVVPEDGSFIFWFGAVVALPTAIGVAILRHRLYDIDVLINRALVYGALSATLVGTYVISVLALTALVRPVTGSGDIAVAGSTLAVVALFQPLRGRLQRAVDRRFYRARYDAVRTIDRFSTRLREQVDLDQLSGELVAVVDDTIKPAHASLWLRDGVP